MPVRAGTGERAVKQSEGRDPGTHRKRIIVLGIYVVSMADDIYKGVMKSMQDSPMFKAMYPTGDPFRGPEMVFSKKGVISRNGTIQSVIDVAHSALPARAQ